MTKAQEVHEKVEALVASDVRKADAFHQVADEYGQPFNSIRGAYYAHTRATSRTAPSSRSRRSKREMTTADAIESATLLLNRAIAQIDTDIAAAKQRADDAKTTYEQLKDTATERKKEIQAKIDALNT
jgi:hypothetical protein